jgi:hypothetical protein
MYDCTNRQQSITIITMLIKLSHDWSNHKYSGATTTYKMSRRHYDFFPLVLILLNVLETCTVMGKTLHVYMDSDPLATSNNTVLNFIPTFESFLSREVNALVPGNWSFQLHHYDGSVPMDSLVANNEIDLYYGAPHTATCLQSTYFASPIVTARKVKPGGGAVTAFGGAIVVSSGNTKLNKLEDLKGAIIGARQQTGWASNVLQMGVLSRSGVEIFRDAKQVHPT